MKRITIKTEIGVTVPETEMHEAIARLAAYEDVYAVLAENAVMIPQEMEKLKAAGKEKSVRYREMLGQKLMETQFRALFQRHGITFDNTEG